MHSGLVAEVEEVTISKGFAEFGEREEAAQVYIVASDPLLELRKRGVVPAGIPPAFVRFRQRAEQPACSFQTAQY